MTEEHIICDGDKGIQVHAAYLKVLSGFVFMTPDIRLAAYGRSAKAT